MSDDAEALIRITTHEAVCAERYANINMRVGKIETLLYAAIGGILLQLIGACGYLFTRVLQ